MAHIEYRETARRQHRELAAFLALQCWMQKLDGVTLDKDAIKVFLDLERLDPERIEWLQEDAKDLFPDQKYDKGMESLTLSRCGLGLISQTVIAERGKKVTGFAGYPRFGILRTLPATAVRATCSAFEEVTPLLSSLSKVHSAVVGLYLSQVVQGKASPKDLVLVVPE